MTQVATREAIKGLQRIGRLYLRNPLRWTRNTLARDKNSKSCPCHSKNAFAFCAMGAIENFLPRRAQHLAREALRQVIPKSKDSSYDDMPRGIADWNDKQSRASTVGNKFFKAAEHLRISA